MYRGSVGPTVSPNVVGGTYTLLVELLAGTSIEVGSLGEVRFEPGWYAYTGSALGPGGFARIDRHHERAEGVRSTTHWHIDYLLECPDATIDTATQTAGLDGECAVARCIDGHTVDGFGATDCGCPSHLVYSSRRAPLLASVQTAHDAVGGDGDRSLSRS